MPDEPKKPRTKVEILRDYLEQLNNPEDASTRRGRRSSPGQLPQLPKQFSTFEQKLEDAALSIARMAHQMKPGDEMVIERHDPNKEEFGRIFTAYLRSWDEIEKETVETEEGEEDAD